MNGSHFPNEHFSLQSAAAAGDEETEWRSRERVLLFTEGTQVIRAVFRLTLVKLLTK